MSLILIMRFLLPLICGSTLFIFSKIAIILFLLPVDIYIYIYIYICHTDTWGCHATGLCVTLRLCFHSALPG